MVNGIKSRLVNIGSGVPKGSIVGPILLLIFINDLPDQCFVTVPCLFADNLKFTSCNLASIQSDANSLLQWGPCEQYAF